MKLEIVFALILGTILGVGGMVGVVFLSKNITSNKIAQGPTNTPSPTPSALTFKINISKEAISHSNKDIEIAGISPDNIPVIISSSDTDYWINPKDNNFSEDISLIPGVNNILISETADIPSIKLKVLSADSIPDGKNYIEGVVTDITAEYIQLRETNGEISQVGINSDTKAITITKNIKTIKVNEVAIGDFIFAVSSDESNKTASNIVVYNSQEESTFPKLITGLLTDYDKKTITIKTKEGDQAYLYSSKTKLVGINDDNTSRKRTKFIDDDLNSNMFLIQSSTDSATPLRTIFIGKTQK